MKTLIALLALTATPAFAQTHWSCDNGRDVESAGITRHGNQLEANLSWDCLPGDGICTVAGPVTEMQDKNGDLSYHGDNFWMVVHVSQPAREGAYKAHVIAYDKKNGFSFNEFLSCQ